jgi:hypothetical protein
MLADTRASDAAGSAWTVCGSGTAKLRIREELLDKSLLL